MTSELGLGMLGSIVKGALVIGLIIGGLIFGIMYWLGIFSNKEEPVPCNCKTSEQIILIHEKRSRFIDAMTYPNHSLTKQEKDSLIDSITKYTNLLK